MFSKIIYDKNLQVLMDNIPISIFIKDEAGQFVYINQACAEMWKEDADALIGKKGSDKIPPEQLELLLASDVKVFAGKVKVEYEELIWSPTHQQNRNYRTTKMPLYDALDKPQFLIIVIQDITEHKQSELHVKRITNLYKALLEVNQAILRLSDEQQLFPLICRCAVELGGMRMAWIAQTNPSTQQILPVAKYGKNLGYIDELIDSSHEVLPEGRGISAISFRENRTIIINNVHTDSTLHIWRDVISGYGWQSIAAFPINRNNQPFAVLSVYHDHNNAFDESVVSLMKGMTRDISFALDNFDRETQRKANEAANSLAAIVYDASSEAMMVTDANHILLP